MAQIYKNSGWHESQENNYSFKKLRGEKMIRQAVFVLLAVATVVAIFGVSDLQAQEAYGRQWGRSYNTQDWNRFYHYPYVYYPQNYYGPDYYKSGDSLYYRYPREMQIPVYNKQWHNYYPEGRKFHYGHHFQLDVF
jgi:hypothetical protein